ncbi:MAG: type II secretion system ATPase GspE [Deltaproteobacteria bacterium]|nr:type II secretion system ATPase GspE [Deltaproteobacteria bacterium]
MGLIKKNLGTILLDQNLINEKALSEALAIQKTKGGKLGKILVQLGHLTEVEMLRGISLKFGLPFEQKIDFQLDKDIIQKIPFQFCKQYKMVPFTQENGQLKLAISDPLQIHLLDDVRLLCGQEVEAVICPEDTILEAIHFIYHQAPESAEKMVKDLDMEDPGLLADIGEEERDILDMANEAPIIKLVNLILVQAVKDRASDVHVEPFERELRVRYRIDGILYDTLTPPKKYQTAITSRIKIMSKMNIAEKRLPQDGRMKIKLADREVDIRVSTIPTAFGERVVMRLLDKNSSILTLQDLGFPQKALEDFSSFINYSHGIILVTGPTGSGKTTTLYAGLSKINFSDKNIITVEDPIEYQLEGIAQIQVKPKINLSFSNGLRSILRQDPDVIMVGEIRDLETAEIAIQASLTGHLVFSTLHTNDSAGAITRLHDMGVEPYLVASSVIAILAQRLVRILCPKCKEAVKPDPISLEKIGLTVQDLPEGVVYTNSGCPYCLQSGYRGRTGIYELLAVDDEVCTAIMKRSEAGSIKKICLKRGMISLRRDGATKVTQGITSIEEVLRVTQEDIL